MSFGERLKKLIDQEDLTPSQFADTVGLNRSAISHVLNNRNKPGYEFMQKVNKAFPDWDFDWLMFSKKSTAVKKTSTPKTTPPPPHQVEHTQTTYSQGTLFSEPPPNSEKSNTPTIRKVVTKTILIYNDGTFEIYQNNLQ